jgi:hypothetical protein
VLATGLLRGQNTSIAHRKFFPPSIASFATRLISGILPTRRRFPSVEDRERTCSTRCVQASPSVISTTGALDFAHCLASRPSSKPRHAKLLTHS